MLMSLHIVRSIVALRLPGNLFIIHCTIYTISFVITLYRVRAVLKPKLLSGFLCQEI